MSKLTDQKASGRRARINYLISLVEESGKSGRDVDLIKVGFDMKFGIRPQKVAEYIKSATAWGIIEEKNGMLYTKNLIVKTTQVQLETS